MVSRRDRRMFARAVWVAALSKETVRVGAVLTKGRTILAESPNLRKNATGNVPHGHETVHAERAALRGHENRFGLTMYVARLSVDNLVMPSHPCPECTAHLIHGTAVKRVVYMEITGRITETKV